MKQVLLRVAAVFAKIYFRKFAQPLFCEFFLPRKILLFQNSLAPDVNRKCAQPLVGKEHYAIRYLRSYAGQRAQLFSKIGIRKSRP